MVSKQAVPCLFRILGLFAVQPYYKISGWYTSFLINHSVWALPCSVFTGCTISHHSAVCSEQYEKQEKSHDANESFWQVIINVVSIAFSNKGPCMSHSIILLTRSSCKCGVLFKGYPSVINNRQVPCLSSLSIGLKGHLGTSSRKRRIWEVHFEELTAETIQFWKLQNRQKTQSFI